MLIRAVRRTMCNADSPTSMPTSYAHAVVRTVFTNEALRGKSCPYKNYTVVEAKPLANSKRQPWRWSQYMRH